jgi:hypothetical protein
VHAVLGDAFGRDDCRSFTQSFEFGFETEIKH